MVTFTVRGSKTGLITLNLMALGSAPMSIRVVIGVSFQLEVPGDVPDVQAFIDECPNVQFSIDDGFDLVTGQTYVAFGEVATAFSQPFLNG